MGFFGDLFMLPLTTAPKWYVLSEYGAFKYEGKQTFSVVFFYSMKYLQPYIVTY